MEIFWFVVLQRCGGEKQGLICMQTAVIYTVLTKIFQAHFVSSWIFHVTEVVVGRSANQQAAEFFMYPLHGCLLDTWCMTPQPFMLGMRVRNIGHQQARLVTPFLYWWWVTQQNRLIEAYRSLCSLVLIHIKSFTIGCVGVIRSFPQYHLS